MTIELKMPAMSPTMEAGTLARWLVGPGDVVRTGNLIAEIETDKASMELEAVDEGWIDTLVVPAGTDDVPVGAVIAILTSSRPDRGTGAAPAANNEPSTRSHVSAEAVAIGGGESAQGQPTSKSAASETVGAVVHAASPPNATALALRLGQARGIDLHGVAAGGRKVLLRDLQPSDEGLMSSSQIVQATVERPSGDARSDFPQEPFRLAASITVTTEAKVDRALILADQLSEAVVARGVSISIEQFVIKALAVALAGDAAFAARGVKPAPTNDATIIDVRRDTNVTDLTGVIVRGAEVRSLSAIAALIAEAAVIGGERHAESPGSMDGRAVVSIAEKDHSLPAVDAWLVLTVGGVRRRVREVDGDMKFASVLFATATFRDRSVTRQDAVRLLRSFQTLLENPFDLAV